MKRLLLRLLIGTFAAVTARATLPIYTTVSAYGSTGLPATAYFVENPACQVRVVTVNYASDTNQGVLNFYTGATAYWETATNAAAGLTNWIDSTNGLSPNGLMVLNHNGVLYTNTVLSWSCSTNFTPATTNQAASGGTNLVLAAGGWTVGASVGDNVYLMSGPTPIPVGAQTNMLNGDALYVGNFGRPVMVTLGPASTTNRLYTVSARYDTQ